MKNTARIVKDIKNNVYFQVYGKNMSDPSYFLIRPIGIEDMETKKVIKLSNLFNVDLKSKEV